MPSSEKKWNITYFSVFIFILVVNPYTYQLTNKLLGNYIGPTINESGPTLVGLILHTIVYMLIVRYSMDLDIV